MRKNKILVKIGYDPNSGLAELLNITVRHNCPVIFGSLNHVLEYFPLNKFDLKIVQSKVDLPF